MHTVGVDRNGQIDPIVHDERDARSTAPVTQPLGQRQEPARRPFLLAKLDHPAAAGDRRVEDLLEVAASRGRPIEDDVERWVHQVRRRTVSTLLTRPSWNDGSSRTLRWNGMDVLTPSRTVSRRARRIRSIASSRLAPRTMILARSES